MTKRGVATFVTEAAGLPLSRSLRVVEMVLQRILDCLVRGAPVMIAGFGKFSIRQRQAAGGKPSDGERRSRSPRGA